MIGGDGCIFQVKSLILCFLPLFPLFIGIECKFSKICLTTQTKTSLEEIEEPFEEPRCRINHLGLQFCVRLIFFYLVWAAVFWGLCYNSLIYTMRQNLKPLIYFHLDHSI